MTKKKLGPVEQELDSGTMLEMQLAVVMDEGAAVLEAMTLEDIAAIPVAQQKKMRRADRAIVTECRTLLKMSASFRTASPEYVAALNRFAAAVERFADMMTQLGNGTQR